MYNRYVRNDNGDYTRIPEQGGPSDHQASRDGPQPPDGQQNRGSPPTHDAPADHNRRPMPPAGPPPPGHGGDRPPGSGHPPDGLTGLLRGFLDRLHLDQVDTGDLLLLGLLFFLFREDADEELLVALGLLLIL